MGEKVVGSANATPSSRLLYNWDALISKSDFILGRKVCCVQHDSTSSLCRFDAVTWWRIILRQKYILQNNIQNPYVVLKI